MNNVNIVLLHNNIVNKYGNIVETSITNIDVHDIARTCRTYGVSEYSIITRLSSQKKLLADMLSYWIDGDGGNINPDRKTALSIVNHYDDLSELEKKYADFKYIVTDARFYDNSKSYIEMKKIIEDNPQTQFFVLFGTGWGIDPILREKSHYVLNPIEGKTDYNHLSVRAAAAIIIDRLFG
ncbi:MAG: RNA methyltransferase [Candidatus Muiribacteriota bacterium]